MSRHLPAVFFLVAAVPACIVVEDSPPSAPADPQWEPIPTSAEPTPTPSTTPRTAAFDFLYTRWAGDPILALGNLQGESHALRRLSGGVGPTSQAALSPDGGRVAFTTFDSGASAWSLRVLDLDTQAEHQVALVIGPGARPAWSPDGKQLAYTSFAGIPFTYDVLRIPVDGGTAVPIGRAVVPDAETSTCIAPQWSPDGREIAFSAIDAVEVVRVSDSAPRVVAPGRDGRIYCEPRWSPDGAQLAYAWTTWNARTGWDAALERVRSAGGTPVRVTAIGGATKAGQVRWSPDGKTLAYVDFYFDNERSSAALRIVDAAGGDPELLDMLDAGIDSGHPQWSPDGSRLLYVRFEADPIGRAPLTVFDVGCGGPVDVGLDGASIGGTYPSWLPRPIHTTVD